MIDREEIARRHQLPEGFGERLVGETAQALEADAAAMAALRQRLAPRPVGKHDGLMEAAHPGITGLAPTPVGLPPGSTTQRAADPAAAHADTLLDILGLTRVEQDR